MKKILLIPVGGTICAAVNERGTLSVARGTESQLAMNFAASDSPRAGDVRFDITDNLGILSENMTVALWNSIIALYRDKTEGKAYDGVIIAHGTDTLAYTAALFSLLLAGTDIPVFFVSANAPLDSPRTNGNANFRCAAECICEGIAPGVYAVYRNISDGRMYLHAASKLRQCGDYSADFFSDSAIDITGGIGGLENKTASLARPPCSPAEGRSNLVKAAEKGLTDCVLMIRPYVGINYAAYDCRKFKAVLHGAYHSGTACSGSGTEYDSSSIRYLLDRCAEAGTDVYLTPARLTGSVYDTVRVIAKHPHPPLFLYGDTLELAYAKLLLLYS